MTAPASPKPILTIDALLTYVIWVELRDRAKGVRESGAFLLADVSSVEQDTVPPVVRRAIYYDDLDPNCLTGGISLAGTAYDLLWRICSAEKLTVVADVHTHPERWVRQSAIDSRNPMIAMRGHLAFILPGFATGKCTTEGIGLYRYEGNHEWTTLEPGAEVRVALMPASSIDSIAAVINVIRRRMQHLIRGRA